MAKISLKFSPDQNAQLGQFFQEYNESDMTQETFVELIKPILATKLEDAQAQLQVVYGCQVWWEPVVEEKTAVPLQQAGSCCGGSTPCCSTK